MKKLLVIVVVLLGSMMLSGCGLQNQINGLKNRADQTDGSINDLKNRVALLESQMSLCRDQLVILGDALSSQGSDLNSQISSINSQLQALIDSGNATNDQLSQLQLDLSQAMSDTSVLADRVSTIEGNTSMLNMSISGLQSDLLGTNTLISHYVSLGTDAYNHVQSQISSLQASSTDLTFNVSSLQSQVNSSLVQLAVLQGYQNIVSIKDPCGAQGAYNEVFLKLSSGHYLASFSDNANGLNTRFTQLTDGNFVTTDGTHCNFTVSGDGTVISNEHN